MKKSLILNLLRNLIICTKNIFCSKIVMKVGNMKFSESEILKADANGNLVAIALGTSKVKAIVDFYGTQLVSNEVSITVTDANIPDGAYIEHVGVSLDKEISLYDYMNLSYEINRSATRNVRDVIKRKNPRIAQSNSSSGSGSGGFSGGSSGGGFSGGGGSGGGRF